MRKQIAISALFMSVLLFAHAQSPAASKQAAAPDALQSYLQPLVNNHTIAGAVTLVSTKDHTIYLKATGFRDLAAKAPMPADALFWIASTSKPITATALMMLVDEGKVNLDDPVEKYLPEFKGQMVNLTYADSAQKAQGAAGEQRLVPANHPILVRAGSAASQGCCAQFCRGAADLSAEHGLFLLKRRPEYRGANY